MTRRHRILDGLTEPQRRAVTHTEGPLLVVAGAGSGKTRVITRRVAYLASQGAPPHRILAVTFTNKAAGEMRERIEALCGAGRAWVSTFHSLCASMLRFSADQVGLDRHFSIYDRDDQLRVVKDAMKRLEVAATHVRPATVLHKISQAKNRLLTPQGLAAAATGYSDELAARLYGTYQALLEENAALDFDDLLLRAADLLERHEAFRERWQQRFQFVLIDEYQDTNRAQYLIAQRLTASHRNLCATGDADQAIYGWRGADIRNILDFHKDFPDALVVKLERNYRSTPVILDAANSLITRNTQRHERGLWTEKQGGAPVRFRLAADADDEARLVLQAIEEGRAGGRRLADFAVFYRTNAQSRAFETALVKAGVPCRLVGAVQFYQRQEIKDLLATLRVLVNERDTVSLERIINTPSRGIGAKTLARLHAWADSHDCPLATALPQAEEIPDLAPRETRAVLDFARVLADLREALDQPVADLCDLVLERTGYQAWLLQPENEDRRDNVREFLNTAAAFDLTHPGGRLADFLQEVSLVSDVDNLDRSADAVTLMTLHAAKGLEFPVVCLTGLEESLLPHANAIRPDNEWGLGEDQDKVEEERRLCYVGMTRAQEELLLTAARTRVQYGNRDACEREPSRFLAEVSPDVFDEASRAALAEAQTEPEPAGLEAPFGWRPRARPRRRASAEPAASESPPRRGRFAVGDLVNHLHYGKGRILAIQPAGKHTFATINLLTGGKRVFALEEAPLEKL